MIVTESISLETVQCYKCGITFAMPAALNKERLTNGGDFYCPNGHGQYYGTPEVKKLQTALDQAQRSLSAAKCETLLERRKREYVEAKHTRLQKRVTNGVCPCCKRTFTNLARHMKTKHSAQNEKDHAQRRTP